MSIPYRRQCDACQGPIAVVEVDDGKRWLSICPHCSNRPDMTDVVSKLPTLTFLKHAETCPVCEFPRGGDLCTEGIERLRDCPGYWSLQEVGR